MAVTIRVLLVEDDANDAELIVRTLVRAGFSPDWTRVQTKDDYLNALNDFSPEIILADYNLPQFNALEALRLMQKQRFDIPFIIVSGAIGEECAVMAVKEGANDYLLKDRLARLGSAVTHALEEKSLRKQKREAEEAQRRAEEKFKMIFDNAVEGIIQTTPAGQILMANRAMAQILGYNTPEELIGSIHDVNHQLYVFPEDRQSLQREIETKGVLRGFETEVYRKDRSKIWISCNGHVLREKNGETSCYEGTAEDITARKMAERRLALQYAITSGLSESASINEVAPRILESICDTIGFQLGELWTPDRNKGVIRCVESRHATRSRVLPQHKINGFAEFEQYARTLTFESGTGLAGRVWRERRPIWIPDVFVEPDFQNSNLLRKTGLRAGFGFPILVRDEPYGVMTFFADEIREPDSALLQAVETAGRQIGQFIGRLELEQQFRQSQKLEAFGQLAGGVAHDFNNLLTVIAGYSNLLLIGDSISPETRDHINQVLMAAEKASNLTRQLLTFSRKKEIQTEPLDLNDVVGSMSKMLQRIIGEDVKLQIRCSASLPYVQADAGMLEQVLLNLAVNARDAMPEGGQLVITTSFAPCDRNNLDGNGTADYACLSVTDNGCGIPAEIQSRIFEPFFTTKGPGRGTGLGLATVYGIVTQHRGKIELESEVGKGTTFKVLLPTIAKPTSVRQRAFNLGEMRGGKETILLVEDEIALRSLTRDILSRLGYNVIEAESGRRAIEIMEEQSPWLDLLLTDMVMPDGINGFQLATQLRASLPQLKVIYTTGYSMAIEGHEAELREGENFLQKPYHPRKLAETIRTRLDTES